MPASHLVGRTRTVVWAVRGGTLAELAAHVARWEQNPLKAKTRELCISSAGQVEVGELKQVSEAAVAVHAEASRLWEEARAAHNLRHPLPARKASVRAQTSGRLCLSSGAGWRGGN